MYWKDIVDIDVNLVHDRISILKHLFMAMLFLYSDVGTSAKNCIGKQTKLLIEYAMHMRYRSTNYLYMLLTRYVKQKGMLLIVAKNCLDLFY